MDYFLSTFSPHYFFPSKKLSFRSFLIFSLIFTTCALSSKMSYNDHCSSIIPPSRITHHHNVQIDYPYLQAGTSYHIGGDRLFGSKSSNVSDYYVSFSVSSKTFQTTTFGVYRIQAYLVFRLPYGNFTYLGPHHSTSVHKKSRLFNRRQPSRILRFFLNGFWSKPDGRLCMLGRAPWKSEEGESLELEGVFKLDYAVNNSNIFTSLAKGSLESLSEPNDPRYFEPIKIVSFPMVRDYDFKLINEGGCVGGNEIPQSQSLSLENKSFCSFFSTMRYDFELHYALDCKDGRNCSPFERDTAYLPRTLSLNGIQCFGEKEKLRYLIKFSNGSKLFGTFDSRTALVGEGSWDRKKNQLCIVACRISHPIDSPEDVYVDDCSTRLNLRFPATWTINDSRRIIGVIWTNKTASDPGYFKNIRFSSSIDYGNNLPGRKYVFTKIDLVDNSCLAKKPGKITKRYPNAYSSDMSFDIFVHQSNKRIAWGRAAPVSVKDELYRGNSVVNGRSDENYSKISKLINISYRIGLYGVKFNDQISSLNSSLNPEGFLEIIAEGVYNPQTGGLCMVGCRNLKSIRHKLNGKSLDCEILLNFEFPPLYSKHKRFVEGFIYSKREKTDPLYFNGFNITSASFNNFHAKRSTWRVDLEIIMVLVSDTLAVIFLTSQLLYVNKQPEKLPFVSLVMLSILTLGHLIPLVLNFEAMILKSRYQQNVILRGAGWLEVNEVSVRVVTLIAFVLLFRLLQLAWTARSREENGKASWKAEKRVLFVSLPIYIIGGLISIFVNWKNISNPIRLQSSISPQPPSLILKYLRSYAGLILDGYLFPQILFNMFHDSRESALSPIFYIGTTLVRLLPHGYDIYRNHNFSYQDFGASYIYANHAADFYSIAWDLIIPFVCVLFALIILLQQKFGGNCIVPKKLREVQLYEKVPVESNE